MKQLPLLETLKSIKDKRYLSDFEEIRKIGSGGFSSVFEVKNKLDDNFYAVKKIQLKIKNQKRDINAELERVLREARFLANIFHPNILRYYNCWIEMKMYESFETLKQDTQPKLMLYNPQPFRPPKISDSNSFSDSEEFFLEIESDSHSDFAFEDPSFEKNKKKQEKGGRGVEGERKGGRGVEGERDGGKGEEKEKGGGVRGGGGGKQGGEKREEAGKEKKWIEDGENKKKKGGKIKVGTGTKNGLSEKEEGSRKWVDRGGKENIHCPQPQKNPILKQLEKKAGNIKQDIYTPPPRTGQEEESERIKSIMIYIQSERCDSTLEIYLEKRNAAFFERKNGQRSILKAPFFPEIITIVEQILAGLMHIHKHCQLVHRDLKPSNIFLHEGLNVKIGDFGLVKKLENLAPVEPPLVFLSPSISQEGSPAQGPTDPSMFPLPKFAEEINNIRTKAQTPNLEVSSLVSSDFKTRNCGTKTYASPEQMSQNCFFDFRADIYSLGIIFLQLFHPMQTMMEINKTINNLKKKNLPKDFQRDLPEIAQLLLQMVEDNPEKRPNLKFISDVVKTLVSRVAPNPPSLFELGKFSLKKENSDNWENKFLKLSKNYLYCFARDEDRKAENVYNLSECVLTLLSEAQPIILVEHSIQFSCSIYANDVSETKQLFELLKKGGNQENS